MLKWNGEFYLSADGSGSRERASRLPPRADWGEPDKKGSGHIWLHHRNCYDWNCYVCEGGLAICMVCGLVEGELTTKCVGRPLSQTEWKNLIGNGGNMDWDGAGWIIRGEIPHG